MVGNPVDDDLHSEGMGLFHKFVKVFQRAEFRIDGAVVPDGIVGAETALAALHSDRVERH